MSATLKQCAILAGGLGTRLGDIVRDVPKPILEVAKRPFIAWLMREMLRFGVEEFLILTGHLSATVEEAVLHAADALPKPVKVTFSEEPLRAGTGWRPVPRRKAPRRPLPALQWRQPVRLQHRRPASPISPATATTCAPA